MSAQGRAHPQTPADVPDDDLPLASRKIVNTRAPHQAEELDRLLRARGATPLDYPCIDIAPPTDPSFLDATLLDAAAGRFGWLVLTSANTVRAIAVRLDELGFDLRGATGLRVAAVGPATADAARAQLGLPGAVVPQEYVAESLVELVTAAAVCRVLLPQADLARPILADRLGAAGAEVTVVTAYRTVQGRGGVHLPRLLEENGVDAVILASPSAARHLLSRLEEEGGSAGQMERVRLACIGTVTARAARQLGLRVDVCPEEHTLPALVEALGRSFSDRIGEQ